MSKTFITITCTDRGGSTFHARCCLGFSATATCSANTAVVRCAAKALGLVAGKKPAGMRMRDYYQAVGAAAGLVTVREVMPGVWTARKAVAL